MLIFSGSRRLGFYCKKTDTAYLPDHECLMFQLNESPHHIFQFRMRKTPSIERPKILGCNYIGE